jgi:hypothetical protein
MTRNLKYWAFGLLWLLIVAGLAAPYVTGQIGVSTLIFLEALAVGLGVTGVVFGRKMTSADESLTDIVNELYQTAPFTPGAFPHDEAPGKRRSAA